MKIGKDTGSLVNHLSANRSIKLDEIVVGETGATHLSWTDRHAATVIDVFQSGKFTYIVTQEDHAKRVDDNGIAEWQEYEYSRNPEGNTYTWRVTDRGFKGVQKNPETGRWVKYDTGGLMIGYRDHYYDFSF